MGKRLRKNNYIVEESKIELYGNVVLQVEFLI